MHQVPIQTIPERLDSEEVTSFMRQAVKVETYIALMIISLTWKLHHMVDMEQR